MLPTWAPAPHAHTHTTPSLGFSPLPPDLSELWQSHPHLVLTTDNLPHAQHEPGSGGRPGTPILVVLTAVHQVLGAPEHPGTESPTVFNPRPLPPAGGVWEPLGWRWAAAS